MRKKLDKTDVVIVGMGAAGGVAALPLTNAGLNVIGIEAGGWLNPRDFAPDELRNGTRNSFAQALSTTSTAKLPSHPSSENAFPI